MEFTAFHFNHSKSSQGFPIAHCRVISPWRNPAHPFNFTLIKPEKTFVMWPNSHCSTPGVRPPECSTRARSPGSRPAEQKKTWQHLFVKVCHRISGNLIVEIVGLEATPTRLNLPPLPVKHIPYSNIIWCFLWFVHEWTDISDQLLLHLQYMTSS